MKWWLLLQEAFPGSLVKETPTLPNTIVPAKNLVIAGFLAMAT